MDSSDITVKLLDDDGNVQTEKQISKNLLKSKSNTIKEMFDDIAVSEVCIPMSEIPVKTWDEIESLWKLWDAPYSRNGNFGKLATKGLLAKKTLGEIVYLLNSLEYLHEPNGWFVSSIDSSETSLSSEKVNSNGCYYGRYYYAASLSDQAVLELAERILTFPNNGYEPALQHLKPRLKELVINSMGRKSRSYEYWMNPKNVRLHRRTFMFEYPNMFKEIISKSPETITIPQAVVLVKILKEDELGRYMTEDGRIIDEFKIYNTIDKNIRREVEHYFSPNGCCSCCTIL
jgi:hypothetical protein